MFTSAVEEMCMHHQGYLDAMRASTTSVSNQGGDLSSVFLRVAAGLRSTYHTYLNRMLLVRDMLERRMKRDDVFVEFLDRQSKRSVVAKGMGFPAFFIQPLQRLVGYGLLLERLVKYTPDEDVHFSALQQVLRNRAI